MRKLLIVCSLLAMNGCASILQRPATGPLYSDAVHTLGPAGTAWITFLRPVPGIVYAGEPAQIEVDGTSKGSVAYLGFMNLDVAGGKHELTVAFNGSCKVDVELKEGQHYYFEIDVRSSAASATLVGGYIGSALESAGKPCGGAFSVNPVPEAVALSKLSNLRQS
ncbi:hypothetical protein IHE49_15260 [Rhodanobacter sp. 7MK24]|uniref:hypothetical protein n=1 Tax=Rhodanobacter sp. 7MK24 TaxID=2775922 RepID=UPI001783931B|nr:hypothetical protein [Rhodanobacter sp. 7MK24]MBD8881844.1 hypothetical protein [Rhodanobacter sp. 7MK24]